MAGKQYTIIYTHKYNASTNTYGYSDITSGLTINFQQTNTVINLNSLTFNYKIFLNQMAIPASLEDITTQLANFLVIKVTNTTQGTLTFVPTWSLEEIQAGDTYNDTEHGLQSKTIDLNCQIPAETTFTIEIIVSTMQFTYQESGITKTGSFYLIYRYIQSVSLDLAYTQGADLTPRIIDNSCVLTSNSSVLWSDFDVSYVVQWLLPSVPFSGKRFKGATPITGELPVDPWEIVTLAQLPVLSAFPPDSTNTFFDWTRHEPSAPAPYNIADIQTEGGPAYSYYPANPLIWKVSLNYDTYEYQQGHWEINPETGQKEWIIDGEVSARKNYGFPWILGFAQGFKPQALFLYVLFNFLFKDSNGHDRQLQNRDLTDRLYYDAYQDVDPDTQWVIPTISPTIVIDDSDPEDIIYGCTPSGAFPAPLPATAWEYTGDTVVTKWTSGGANIVNNNKQQKYYFTSQQ